MFVLFLGKR